MRKIIGKNVLSLFILFSAFFIAGCSQPTNQKDTLDPEEQKRIEEQKKLAEEQKKKEELFTAARKLVVGKTFKQIDNWDVKTSDEYNFVSDGDVYVFGENEITIKTSKGDLTLDFSPFNIKTIKYNKYLNYHDYNTYEITFLDKSVFLYIFDKSLLEIRINGYDNKNMDGRGALIWDGTDDTGNTGGSGTGGSTDLSSFIQGDWNYSAFIANQNRACTLSLSGGNITASWVNTTVTGTYSVNSSVLHVDFKRTQGGNSADYEGDFEIELVNDTSFKLKAGNYLESFAMLFGVTGSEITFTK